MKARKKALDIPEGAGFWSVDLGADEPNLQHFEMPRFTLACAALALGDRYSFADSDSHLARAVLAQYHAAITALCWHNRVALLETPQPDGPVDDFGKYGELAVAELQTRYDLDQITLMGEACDEEVRKRLGYVVRAAERAKSFTAAEDEAGAPQKAAAEQSSPEK